MLQLKATSADQIEQFGRHLLFSNHEGDNTFETIAQYITRRLHTTFVDEQGRPAFALVRIFRYCTTDELPPLTPLQTPPHASERAWLALCGTTGDEAAWCDRLQSKAHQLIPAGAFDTPMLKAAFEQLEIDPFREIIAQPERDEADVETKLLQHIEGTTTEMFYIETALGSPYIVDQETFVKPYAIQSAVGIGSRFVGGSFYMCIAFSKVKLSRECADKFGQMSPFISTLLAIYDRQKLWNSI